MKSIIALPLLLCAFSSVASGAVSGEIQAYPDYLSAYVKMLVKASCDHVLSEDGTNSIDRAIKSISASATKGMTTDTESYYAVYNSLVFGVRWEIS